jgi:predicted ABC-type ATPase
MLAGFGVGLGVSALDPINLASAFVPVVGQARWLAALRATSGLTRFGARAGLGAIEGAAGAAAVEPIVWGVARHEQADYGAVDALMNVAFGAALGGGLHSVGGAIGDKLGWTRIAREELEARGRVPGALDTAARVLHPERERAARTALSQLADGRPVDVTGALDAEDRYARWKMGDPWPAEIEEARIRSEAIEPTHAIATEEREQLRADIVRRLYGRGAAFKQREAWIVLGLPGAGKSTALVQPLARQHGALVIDSDLAKPLLPEYRDGIGARAVHLESDLIGVRVLNRAIENGDNIVNAVVGRSAQGLDVRIDLLRQAGYRINLHFLDLPAEEAARRAMRRFHEEGRFLDPQEVLRVGDGARNNFEVFKHDPRVAQWALFSNAVARGQAPRPVAAGRNEAAPQLLGDRGAQRGGGDTGAARTDRGEGAQAPGHSLDRGVAHTTSGTRLQVRYRVVDAGDLVASHNLDLSENPAFPRDLQPRERGRAAGGEQVQKIAAELNPELLAHSPLASEGAPIVGPDLVVESGNGRISAIETKDAGQSKPSTSSSDKKVKRTSHQSP